jgi:hypothetical protein
MKSERELRKQLSQCNRELRTLGPCLKQSSDTQTIALKKYWTSKRARVRAYLRGYQRRREANKPRSNTQGNITPLTERSTQI